MKTHALAQQMTVGKFSQVFVKAFSDVFGGIWASFLSIPEYIMFPAIVLIIAGSFVWIWYNFLR
jgi:hypothetical protein